ncbi:hypothetical protein LRH25_26195 [Ideonella azotifigens]|uniref:Uncharacterized protein n=1 Tax=Ideonella azotifigens TaxID=513160 RepID=A0ABP3VEK6_9BURK|nr:hypothetical protein [Ideonella azotifigens]MCD2343819.1 hypothetical protein [Ideonella azotifigens]
MTSCLVLLLAAGLVWRVLALQHALGRYALVRRERHGWRSQELRRRSANARMPHDSQPYPQPREFRVRCQRWAGIPVWHAESVVSLPPSTAGYVERVAAADYDHLFPAPFSLRGH